MKLIAIHRLITSGNKEIAHNTEFESREYGIPDEDIPVLLEKGAVKRSESTAEAEKPAQRKDKVQP